MTAIEALTRQQCDAMRGEAARAGYTLTWSTSPTRGLTWYARRGTGAPIVLGATDAVRRFLDMQRRWGARPGFADGKRDRWARQKQRSATARAARRQERAAGCQAAA